MSDELRPQSWSEYVGQEALKRELSVRIRAAREQHRPLDPFLFVGPPGAGKTSLATIIAQHLGEPLETILMPVTERALINLFKQFQGVVLIDEIHAGSRRAQESLQGITQERVVSDSAGRKFELGRVSILAATTREDMILEPLRDRFDQREFEAYTDDEMSQIVLGMADRCGMVGMNPDVALAFAQAACGTPRKAKKMVLAYRDLYLANGYSPGAGDVMAMLRVEYDGLTANHVRYLQTLGALGVAKGHGLKLVANLMRQSDSTILELERLLIEKGLIEMSSTGRELSPAGLRRLRELDQDAAA